MSWVSKTSKFAARVTGLTAIVLLSAVSSSGQYGPMATYVCQTPGFWCAIQAAPGFPNGTPCWCNTMWGPVGGYSIIPAGVPNAPKLPRPQQPQDPGNPAPQPQPGNPPEIDQDDCYKGLGNCPGSYTNSAKAGGKGSGARKGSSTSGAGATAAMRTFDGTLAEGGSRRITLQLEAGRSYTITGECDADCDDLDFILRRAGSVVDDDTASDSVPIVRVTPKSAGTYTLEIRMEGCATARCGYSVEIEED
jgi:hypothetical protein